MITDRTPTAAATFVLSVAAVVTTLLADLPTAAAGPWTKEPGEAYAKLSVGYFDATGAYDLEGELEADPPYEYSHTAVRLYSEIGVLPHLAFGFSLPFLQSQNTVDTRTHYRKSGPGDLDLFVQGGTKFGNCAASLRFRARIPLYAEGVDADSESATVSAGSTGRERYMPVLGDGSVDLAPTGSFGCSFYPVPAWASVEAGPKFRLGGFGHGLEYAVDVGAFVWPNRLALTARLGGVQRFTTDNPMPTKSYLNFSGGLIFKIIDQVGIEATAGFIPTGTFVAKGWNASIGVSYDGRLWPNPFGGT